MSNGKWPYWCQLRLASRLEKRVFVVSSVPFKDPGAFAFEVHCYDRSSGQLLWKQTAVEAAPHQPTHNTNTHASASPCTDASMFTLTSAPRLVLLHAGWPAKRKRDFGDMNTRNSFGEGSSPTLAGNMIIVPWIMKVHPRCMPSTS